MTLLNPRAIAQAALASGALRIEHDTPLTDAQIRNVKDNANSRHRIEGKRAVLRRICAELKAKVEKIKLVPDWEGNTRLSCAVECWEEAAQIVAKEGMEV